MSILKLHLLLILLVLVLLLTTTTSTAVVVLLAVVVVGVSVVVVAAVVVVGCFFFCSNMLTENELTGPGEVLGPCLQFTCSLQAYYELPPNAAAH